MKKFIGLFLLCGISSAVYAVNLVNQVIVIPELDNPNPPPAATLFLYTTQHTKQALNAGSYYNGPKIVSGYIEVEGASSACQSPLSSSTCRYSLPTSCINLINLTSKTKEIAMVSGSIIPQYNGTFLVNFFCN